MINSRVYVFQNLQDIATENTLVQKRSPVKVIDCQLKQVFDMRLMPTTKKDDPPNSPSGVRVNYAITEVNHRVFLYGGINAQNEVLECMDVFDAQTYKMHKVKYRLDYKPKGRQAAASIAVDKQTMLVIGGSFETGFCSLQPVPANDCVQIFDPDASTWRKLTVQD